MSQSALTRGDIVSKVSNLVQDLGSSSLDLFDLWIHDVHREIETRDFSWLLEKQTITIKAGKESYTLRDDFRKVADQYAVILKQGTQESNLDFISSDEFNDLYQTHQAQSGQPIYYRFFGSDTFVQDQPTALSKINFQSTSDLDTQTVFIKGRVGPNTVAETLTLTGITALDSVNSYNEVSVISLSGSPNGTVTAKADAGATILNVFSPGIKAMRFKKFNVFPRPTATYDGATVDIWFFSRIPDLIHDLDISIVPDSNALIHGVMYYANLHQNDKVSANNNLLLFDAAIARMASEEPDFYVKENQVTPETFKKRAI